MKRPVKLTPTMRSHDDMELDSFQANPNKNVSSLILEQTMKLDTKSKQLEKILGTVNAHIVNSTMNDVIRLKPIFDEEKLKLIRLRIVVNKLYDHSRDSTTEFVFVEMSTVTEFPEWNEVSKQVNICTKLLRQYLSKRFVIPEAIYIDDGECFPSS